MGTDDATYKRALSAFLASSGKSVEEISEHLGAVFGTNPSNFSDIEYHSDEIETVFTLEQFQELARFTGSKPQDLLPLFGIIDNNSDQLSYATLVLLAKQRVGEIGIDKLEEKVGWSLESFFNSREEMARSYTVLFFMDLARELCLDWRTMLLLP